MVEVDRIVDLHDIFGYSYRIAASSSVGFCNKRTLQMQMCFRPCRRYFHRLCVLFET